MTQLAPTLEHRLLEGAVGARELCDIAGALARSRYFDAKLFGLLVIELRKAIANKALTALSTVNVVCWLAELNAYDAGLFEAACSSLIVVLGTLPESERNRMEASLKSVNHEPSAEFKGGLKTKRPEDSRTTCPMFWRGQCKWGQRCKFSHEASAFETSVNCGAWRAPSQSGGRSRGYMQSADLYKGDKIGAMW
eukprot:NODE_16773_length_978_cov_4.464160.p1 GENE.NODE_16773_length_978_cov_4.464160~~NODE_16773_length_978_cov_4.464160.p1  ORF type:complete len:194 (+),score=65.97 NODE_16773_length_978_cov_4.464160:1-582(+)